MASLTELAGGNFCVSTLVPLDHLGAVFLSYLSHSYLSMLPHFGQQRCTAPAVDAPISFGTCM